MTCCRLTPASPDVRRASAAAQSRAEPLPHRTAPGIIAAAAAAASAGISRSPIFNLHWKAFSLPLLGIKLLFKKFSFLFFFFLEKRRSIVDWERKRV